MEPSTRSQWTDPVIVIGPTSQELDRGFIYRIETQSIAEHTLLVCTQRASVGSKYSEAAKRRGVISALHFVPTGNSHAPPWPNHLPFRKLVSSYISFTLGGILKFRL